MYITALCHATRWASSLSRWAQTAMDHFEPGSMPFWLGVACWAEATSRPSLSRKATTHS